MAGFHYHCSPPIAPQVSVSLPTFNEKRHHAKSRRHIFLGLFWITFIFFTALLYCVPHMREIYSICINPQRIQPLIMGVVQQYVVNFQGVRSRIIFASFKLLFQCVNVVCRIIGCWRSAVVAFSGGLETRGNSYFLLFQHSLYRLLAKI